MARSLFTQEQVFEVADALAADGKEVTALALLSKLGGASLTTIYKHLIAWRESHKPEATPMNGQAIPETVQAAFATALGRAWSAASTEAGKEVAAAKEKAAAEVQAASKQFEEAMQAVERLEEQADKDAELIQSLNNRVAELETALQKAKTTKRHYQPQLKNYANNTSHKKQNSIACAKQSTSNAKRRKVHSKKRQKDRVT